MVGVLSSAAHALQVRCQAQGMGAVEVLRAMMAAHTPSELLLSLLPSVLLRNCC
jgi:hypothetical protein